MPISQPPMPDDQWEVKRWNHTRLRRRMLYGTWEQDLRQRVAESLGRIRAEAYGRPDTSSCVLPQVASELSCLYDVPPSIRREDGDLAATDIMTATLAAAGWSSLMQRVQRDCLGMREMLLHVSVMGPEQERVLVLRPVFPDLVVAQASPYDPTRPVMVREARQRGDKWTWDEVDIRDPLTPSYRVVCAETGRDLSAQYLGVDGGLVGEAYPYVDSAGLAFHPYVLFHASRGPDLWDPYEWSNLVEGSLMAGVRWTLCSHSYLNASWPQRVAAGFEFPGSYTDEDQDGRGRMSIVADPSTVLLLRPDPEHGGQGMLHQWGPGADPTEMHEAATAYESRIASLVQGVGDFQARKDPRSGYAIVLSREGKREAARKYAPTFREGDRQLLGVIARLMNLHHGADLPETGWDVEYHALPPTPQEQAQELEAVMRLLEQRLISRVDAYTRIHAVSREEAVQALAAIDAERAVSPETGP